MVENVGLRVGCSRFALGIVPYLVYVETMAAATSLLLSPEMRICGNYGYYGQVKVHGLRIYIILSLLLINSCEMNYANFYLFLSRA